MLVYLDSATSLRVYRTTEIPGAPRTFIGRIQKTSFEYVQEKEGEPTSEEEERDIQQVVQVYKDAHQSRLRLEASSFPEIARRVAEFYASSASDVEKRLIVSALQQMSRAIRKVDQVTEANQQSALGAVRAS
ncbi:MAG: hypothetical protein KIS73_15270 [Enhydrobacter sp.]|nr:hypothetical protein [Enhydrobacter sp.]